MTGQPTTEIAFFAPLKSPRHPVPSGDRELARNLMQMIAVGPAGGQLPVQVTLASQLRLYEGKGSAAKQQDLWAKAELEVARLMAELPPVSLWVTYHNYYKAPDLIGPRIAKARKIPYVQIESTRASKRLDGPWARFAEAAHEAADAADAIFYLTEKDRQALVRDRRQGQSVTRLPPFLPMDHLPDASPLTGPMLSVGMMREGDKLASYRLIAQALAQVSGDWRLDIAGDGTARPEVEALMAPFGSRVRFLGQCTSDELARHYGAASLFLWPGVNEAFGMVYLEAQSHGLPIVAQDRPGLRDVLAPGSHPAPELGAKALAARIETLLGDPFERITEAQAARDHVAAQHLRASASAAFWSVVTPLLQETQR